MQTCYSEKRELLCAGKQKKSWEHNLVLQWTLWLSVHCPCQEWGNVRMAGFLKFGWWNFKTEKKKSIGMGLFWSHLVTGYHWAGISYKYPQKVVVIWLESKLWLRARPSHYTYTLPAYLAIQVSVSRFNWNVSADSGLIALLSSSTPGKSKSHNTLYPKKSNNYDMATLKLSIIRFATGKSTCKP